MKQRKNPRLQGRDYTKPGGYFVTICTKNMTPYFGKVEEGEVILYQIGKIVERCWYAIPQHHPYVEIDAYVCMPNHVHGIIFITQSVGTKYLSSDKRMNNNSSLRNGAIAGSLGSIIRGFKIGVSKGCTLHNLPFARQSSYHDHIIRNEKDLLRIQEYIQMNPYKRENDKFYLA